MKFLSPDPDKAYISNMLWLPKRHLRVPSVKGALEFHTMGQEQEFVQMWEEQEHHLLVPREFLNPANYDQWPFEFVDVRPSSFQHIDIRTRIKPRTPSQREAMYSMLRSGGGILNLGCGHGKTVVALWLIAKLKVPALIVVNNTSLVTQWRERIEEHLQYEGGVGQVQGDLFDWRHPITIGMIHTLAFHADTWPANFRRNWGITIYDEIHHLAAPLFSRTAPLFYGIRHGLTATPFREDGRESVYEFHIGRVYYSDLTQDLTPRVYFIRTDTELDLNDQKTREEVYDKTGEIHLGKLRIHLGKDEARNDFIQEHIEEMLLHGRKILALTHSVDQLARLQLRFPDSAVIYGNVSQEIRGQLLSEHQLTFATSQLAYEGLDEPSLDTLVLLTPFGARNWVQQAIGRIQRAFTGKRNPLVVIFEDHHISKCLKVCRKAKASLRKLGLDYQLAR